MEFFLRIFDYFLELSNEELLDKSGFFLLISCFRQRPRFHTFSYKNLKDKNVKHGKKPVELIKYLAHVGRAEITAVS